MVGKSAAMMAHNYPQLQNLIKRDHMSYREEFLQQYHHFKASLAIVQLRPASPDAHFESLVTFISHVASLYPESREDLPSTLMNLVQREAATLNASMRKCLIQCLLLLRKYNLIDLAALLELFFRLFRIQDKGLRDFLYDSIVGEIKRANKPQKNNALNKTLQNFMYGLLAESAASKIGDDENLAVHKIIQIVIELYRKGIWDDSRTVNVIADACIKRISPKVMATGLNFFVGRFKGKALQSPTDFNADSDEEDDNGSADYQKLLHRQQLSGTTKASKKKLKRSLQAMHRKEKKTFSSVGKDNNGSFAAIHLLNDPQGFAEKLFGHLKRSNDSFEVKLLLMNVISRVIGASQLILLDFYSFLHRYIQPHQKEVTQILAYAAQASHAMVPGDVMEPLVKAIAHNFVADHCENAVIAAGMNGLREICARCPEAMTEELLQDLAHFKGYHDKGVIMASRSLIALYREVAPTMLHRRDRGKDVSIALSKGATGKLQAYGVHTNKNFLDASKVGRPVALDDEADFAATSDAGEPASDLETEQATDEDDLDETAEDEECESESSLQGDAEDFITINSEGEGEGEHEEPARKGQKSKKDDILLLASQRPLSAEEIKRLRARVALGGKASNAEDEGSASEEDEASDDALDASSSSEEEDCSVPEIVDPNHLKSSKKAKQEYKERMESIMAGREGREKFGSRKGKHNENAGMTNRVKAKRTKNVIMLSHKPSVRAKRLRSMRDRQLSDQKHSKRQKMRH